MTQAQGIKMIAEKITEALVMIIKDTIIMTKMRTGELFKVIVLID